MDAHSSLQYSYRGSQSSHELRTRLHHPLVKRGCSGICRRFVVGDGGPLELPLFVACFLDTGLGQKRRPRVYMTLPQFTGRRVVLRLRHRWRGTSAVCLVRRFRRDGLGFDPVQQPFPRDCANPQAHPESRRAVAQG